MVIQFSHNGPELNISKRSKLNGRSYRFTGNSSGYRYWNNEPKHVRKFMKQSGIYIPGINKNPENGDIYLWGEWESQSIFELTGNRYSVSPSLPVAVHRPVFSYAGMGRHNTDPFVFGDKFYYTNCKQKIEGLGQKLLNLPWGSVILFGAEKGRSSFVIDTVFVTGYRESVREYKEHPGLYPQMLRDATIELNEGLPEWKSIYEGVMYDMAKTPRENFRNTFSFVPCKVDCGIRGFERPAVDVVKYGLQKPGSGVVTKTISYSSDKEFWYDLVKDLFDLGFSLGVKIEMPSVDDKIYFPA